MNWWIGLCGVAGIILTLVLDHLGRKRNNEPWLSAGWPKRFVLVAAAGALVGLIFGILPIQVYRIGEAIIGLYNNPPTLYALFALLPMMVGTMISFWIVGAAERARLRERDRTARRSWFLASSPWFWLPATLSMGGGFFTSFLLIRGL